MLVIAPILLVSQPVGRRGFTNLATSMLAVPVVLPMTATWRSRAITAPSYLLFHVTQLLLQKLCPQILQLSHLLQLPHLL